MNYGFNRHNDGKYPAELESLISQEGMGGLPASAACLGAAVFQTAELWPRMFTEVSAVHGTVWAIGIIGISAFLTVLVFTASPRTSGCVIANILMILTCVLAFFHLAGHQLGIVEAVSISVLLGSSVDYSLHIADAYTECCLEATKRDAAGGATAAAGNLDSSDGGDGMVGGAADVGWCRRRRQQLVHEALGRIGGSVFHASVTTFLSVICLVFCVVTIFVQFGQIIAASVVSPLPLPLLALPTRCTFERAGTALRNHCDKLRTIIIRVSALVCVCVVHMQVSSIVFALLVLPSLLVLYGPVVIMQENCAMRHLFAVFWAVAIFALTLGILWLGDHACDGCVKAPDGTPLFRDLGQ